MRTVQPGPVIGLVAQAALLAALAGTVGLGAPGWVVGLACAVAMDAALARGLSRAGAARLGPADRVTLTRASLVCGVAALTADSFGGPTPVTTLVALATVALVLDAVDGWVARRTGTVTPLGARFDMEVDAFLILVLSVYVAPSLGGWVLAIGAARYASGAAGWALPWLRRPVPPRHWRKVVAAVQGIVLTVAAAGVLPDAGAVVALAVALALLAESFGRDVWWLWRHRQVSPLPAVSGAALGTMGRRGGVRVVVDAALTVLACLLVWAALVAPNRIGGLTPTAFLRIPLEGLAIVVLALVLPRGLRRVTSVLLGLALALLTVVKVLDMGFFAVLDRPFDPVYDWYYLRPAVGVLGDSVGQGAARATVAAAGVLLVLLLVLMPLSVARLSGLVARHRTGATRGVTALGVVWVLAAAAGPQLAPGTHLVSTSAAGLAYDEVGLVRAGLADQQAFDSALASDRFRDTPGNRLLTGLRGKDVIIAFVESYGRVAVQDSSFSPRVDAVLDSGTRRLRAAGFSSRSAFLTSPTFGAASWLAHSTLQSGLWVDSQRRYDQLLTRDRLTLTGAFGRAGWRTVFDVPAIASPWPEGSSFYHYDKLYDAHNVGYRGPPFSYATMPDQYTLAEFRRRELAGHRRSPVMAEIDLVSSHHPWAPLPHLVSWKRVGDGSVFDGMPEQGESPDVVFRDPEQVRDAYGQSVEYSLGSLISFVRRYPDPDLVLVVLGDHQPHTYVTGEGASHDVPVSIIAHDPAVMRRIAGWGWQDGLRPGPSAPVWPMDAFRDRFLTAYGPARQQVD